MAAILQQHSTDPTTDRRYGHCAVIVTPRLLLLGAAELYPYILYNKPYSRKVVW